MMKVKQLNVCLLFAALVQQTLFAAVNANPAGASVINGQVSFSQPDAATLQVTNSPNAIINWQQFNISAQQVTRFVQENGTSAVLNRVVGGNASEILGRLQSNGRVFLINPNGLVIGQDAVIDTAGFIGSTLNISDQDFLNGQLHFETDNAGDIDNQGYIYAGNSGDILLIAPNINNSGVLEVDGGNILLAAGQSITITSLDDANISFEVQSATDSITNLGRVIANDGAANMFAGTLTHTGSVSANGITTDAAGNIRLVAKDTNWIEGEVIATGSQGGDIRLLGAQVGLDGNAVVDASGNNGGGQVLIGGNYQGQGDVQTARASYVGEDVQIKADALDNGDGGRVIVWSDESTRMYGGITARGGELSGDGGFVETSGGYLDIGGNVPDVSSPSGDGGTWLLDPNNIRIVRIGEGVINLTQNPFISTDDNAELPILELSIALGNGDVVIQTSTAGANSQAGDITWDADAILDIAGIGTKTLTLNAHKDINFLGSIDIISTGFGNESLTLDINPDFDLSGIGGFTQGASSVINLAGFSTGIGTLNVNAPGNIAIDGDIDTGPSTSGSVTLVSNAGTISQSLSSTIATANLTATSSGNMNLLGSNSISHLDALVNNANALTFNNSAVLTISAINAIGGIVTLNNTDAISGSNIQAAVLDITSGGDVNLSDGTSDVDAITASTNTSARSNIFFSFTDIDDLEVRDITVSNTSSAADSYVDIVSEGAMTLNGNISATGSGTGSGVTLITHNDADIIHQTGVITSDNINFQTDFNPTSTGAVGTILNPVEIAASASVVNLSLGNYDGEGGFSGGDFNIRNTVGDVQVDRYITVSESGLFLDNTAGELNLSSVTMVDGSGSSTTTLTADNITLTSSGELLLPALVSTVGGISLDGNGLTISNTIDSADEVKLKANAGTLTVGNTVSSSTGNVELLADAFSINGAVTAQNQVVVRELNAAGGLEINDATAQADFATLTTTDLGFLTGTNGGILLGNDLVSTTQKSIQINSAIDSTMINGPTLTFDTTNNSSGSSEAVIAANVDFATGGENLIFGGNGSARIEPLGAAGILVDTGSGNLSSSVSQFDILGSGDRQVTVKTNNADFTGDLAVSSGDQAGSFAIFEGSNLTVQGSLAILANADSSEVKFSNIVEITSPSFVDLIGGSGVDAYAKLTGADIVITSSSVDLFGGTGTNSLSEIRSTGNTIIDTGAITLLSGTGSDADSIIAAGDGQGTVILQYASCTACEIRLNSEPVGNGLADSGIYSRTISLNGSVTTGDTTDLPDPDDSDRLDPVPALNSMLANFQVGYITPIPRTNDLDEEGLSVCR